MNGIISSWIASVTESAAYNWIPPFFTKELDWYSFLALIVDEIVTLIILP